MKHMRVAEAPPAHRCGGIGYRLLSSLLLLFSVAQSHAEESPAPGIGIGALYSGIGMNLAWRGHSSLRYVAAGCVALHHSSDTGWNNACGAGIGWIESSLIPQEGNKHGIGIYLGPIGYRGEPDAMAGTLYGVGLSYNYFFQGITERGWNLGVTVAVGEDEGEYKKWLLSQVGYQF